MMQGLRDMSFVFVFTGNYHLRTGKWMAIPVLAYIFPGIHWRADIGYVAYGAAQDHKEWVRERRIDTERRLFVLTFTL